MLLVPTRVAPSTIQGLGLFAAADIPEGEEVWRFAPGLDLLIPADSVPGLPPVFRAFLDTYGYISHDFPGRLVLSCDHAKFMNHSEQPNIEARDLSSFARRKLGAGEEITCDYRAICTAWTGVF